jgi:6-phosphofructokinase 1
MGRIGVLTGGGDVPGLNAVVKAAVEALTARGVDVLGIRRGWAGLLRVPRAGEPLDRDWFVPLDRRAVRAFDREGGTLLHTSRTNPARLPRERIPERLRETASPGVDGLSDLTDVVLEGIESLALDGLVAIGGDGTLSFARRLHREGVPIVTVPKTMDNDVAGTDYCLGFSTAITRSVALINDLRTVAGSHERVMVVEVFGRRSGEVCLMATHLAGADRAVIAEVPFDPRRVAERIAQDRRESPSGYAVLVASEGASTIDGQEFVSGPADPGGNRKLGGVGSFLAREIERETGARTLAQSLGYLLRAGLPDALDLLVAKSFGQLAAELALSGEFGRMTAVVDGRYTAVELSSVSGAPRVDARRFYDAETLQPKFEGLRGLPIFLH